jgi:hypothetical protein
MIQSISVVLTRLVTVVRCRSTQDLVSFRRRRDELPMTAGLGLLEA